MKFIASSDASNDATIEFTGLDSASYDAYLFILGNVVPATDNVNLRFRTSTDGGVSYDSGASDYKGNRAAREDSQANDTWLTRGGAFSGVPVTTVRNVGSAAGEDGVSGYFYLLMPHLAKLTFVQYTTSFINTGGLLESSVAGAMRDSAADVDAVQFLFSSGDIESGTITMYGLENS